MTQPIFDRAALCLGSALLLALGVTAAKAQDNWIMDITVDNKYVLYAGVPGSLDRIGGDANVFDVESWPYVNTHPNAYLCMVTASDTFVAHGFLGAFTNTTTGEVSLTSSALGSRWEVFPAGQYTAALQGWTEPGCPDRRQSSVPVDG